MGKSFWVVLAVVIAAMVGLFAFLSGNNDAPSQSLEDPYEIVSDDHVAGPEDAPVTLIEYSDFQCPACGNAYSVIKQMQEEFGEDLRFVYRYFTVTEPRVTANDASRAAEAAGKQDMFWEMHDLLFERQQSWTGEPRARDMFTSYAEELGLDLEQYQSDFDNANPRVERDISSARAKGVSSTPTFFLNGEQISLQSFEQLRDLIQAEIDATE